MQFTTLSLSVLLSVASATTTLVATSGTTSTACAAQPVLESCLTSTTAIANNCASNDYGCLCSKWTDVLTCYLQCPNDPRYSGASTTKETYCNDALVYTSSTSSAISKSVSGQATTTATTTSTETTSSGAVRTASSSGTATGSSSGAAATTTSKSDAASLMVGAGGVLMGVAGFVGAFL